MESSTASVSRSDGSNMEGLFESDDKNSKANTVQKSAAVSSKGKARTPKTLSSGRSKVVQILLSATNVQASSPDIGNYSFDISA